MSIGVDIVEVHRIKKLCKKEHFLKRFFTQEEIEPITSKANFYHHVAGKFAAKEAVVKALGTGFRYFKFKDVQILNNKLGKPYVVLLGKAKEIADLKDIDQILISISHCRAYAIAFAMAKGGLLNEGSNTEYDG